jgi:hypothetical protein
MDEILDVAELAVDLGIEGALAWILRILGIVAVLAGLGLWLGTDMGLLVVPAVLLALGVVMLAAPSVLLFVLELGG